MPAHTTSDAYERLKQAIYSGQLGAGERIVERDLARKLKISRIPLRESLVRLQAEGLIRSVPFSSSFVEDFNAADVLEIFSMRLLCEPLATRLVAKRPTPDLIVRLKDLCDRMTRASAQNRPIELDRIDCEFHRAIVEASGHRRLLRAYDSAHILILAPRKRSTRIGKMPPQATAEEHLKIIKRIQAKDADGAERVARAHVQRALRAVENALGMTLDEIGTETRASAHAEKRGIL